MSKSNTHPTTDDTTDAQHQNTTPSSGGPPRIPDDDLIEALWDLAAEVGRTPTTMDMDEDGPYSANTYADHFGSWTAACEVAGLQARQPSTTHTDEDLITSLREMADAYGRTPSSQEMRDEGPHCASTYFRHFGSWAAACKAARLPAPDPGANRGPVIPLADLVDDLRMGALALGRPPTSTDLAAYGAYTQPTYRKRFDGWERALFVAGIVDSDGKVTHDEEGHLVLSPPRLPFVGEVHQPLSSATAMDEIEPEADPETETETEEVPA